MEGEYELIVWRGKNQIAVGRPSLNEGQEYTAEGVGLKIEANMKEGIEKETEIKEWCMKVVRGC